MSAAPVARALILHTGGALSVDVVTTAGARASGDLVRWLAGGPRLQTGAGLEPALDALDLGRTPDGRSASALWFQLAPPGPAPGGTSGDLVLLAAAQMRRWEEQLAFHLPDPGDPDPEGGMALLVTGSGSLDVGRHGEIAAGEVTGWPEKLRQLDAALAAHPRARAALLLPAAQIELVSPMIARLEHGARVLPRAVGAPADLSRALRPLLLRDPEVDALWPSADPGAAAWLAEAERQARAPDLGFLGVQHLLRALERVDGGGLVAGRLRLVRLPEAPSGDRRALVLCRGAEALVPTPRVRRLAEGLRPGFGVEDLAVALARDPTGPLRGIPGLDLGELAQRGGEVATVRGAWEQGPAAEGAAEEALASALEVQGGPEDGRALPLAAGDTVGRDASPLQATHALYQGTRLVDAMVSRQHLRWEGPGRARALRPLMWERAGSQELAPVGAEIVLRVGDRLWLTRDTALLAISKY